MKVNDIAKVVATCVAVLIFLWAVIAITTGFIEVTNKKMWCEGVNGESPYSDTYQETGKRWEYNPWTAGLTGECVDPGDKGL